MTKHIFDYRVERIHSIISPYELCEKIPANEKIYSFVLESRKCISNIINKRINDF